MGGGGGGGALMAWAWAKLISLLAAHKILKFLRFNLVQTVSVLL